MAKIKCDNCGVDLARLEVGVCLECVIVAFPDGVDGPKMTPAGKLPVSRERVDFMGGKWAVSHEVRAGEVWPLGVVIVAQRAGAKVQCFIPAVAWPAWFKWDGKAKRWTEREERRKAVAV